ncbi:glycosyltransferase family 4 protein [Actinoallomurus purpureus]|uniref:glycosyltransferase family 4 protein n=1 Tax=Actinoallomurus purpureus TaxID=478114 RepID=UPI0020926186|nr:glycosyltransferase family 4 protein [Actinoallomurus purpureus]MCO6008537.1 glycosyltransferase family 4 protein [Actinoallomurus purpureus]
MVTARCEPEGANAAELTRRFTVIHVVECWGGGVSSAVAGYIRATPMFEHWLLSAPRHGEDTGMAVAGQVQGWLRLPDSHPARIRAVHHAYNAIRPDIVHAHSSYAGIYVRGCLSIPADRIVYSPHCYAFERVDVVLPVRGMFRIAESILARRTGVVAAASPREAALARMLHGRQQVVCVPHAVRVQPVIPAARPFENEVVAIAVGRICRQKDPDFLAEASREARRHGWPIRWEWIGDGDPARRERLESAGVHVAGWLPRDEVLRRLGRAHVYVHTALWEVAPTMAMLEAVATGLPMIMRSLPDLAVLGLPGLVPTPKALASAVRRMADPAHRAAHADRCRMAFHEHTPEAQAKRLAAAYRAPALPVKERV